jgi:hypothetical protein
MTFLLAVFLWENIMCKWTLSVTMQTLLENIFKSYEFFLKHIMWIDETKINMQTKIQAQTYFHLKDTKLIKSDVKGKNITLYAILSISFLA